MPRYPKLADPDWLASRYRDDGASLRDIASELGCTSQAVSSALRRHGLELRAPGYAGGPEQLRDKKWLETQYTDELRSTEEIGAELGCTGQAVADALRRHGIPTRSRGTRFPQLTDRAWLAAQYAEHGTTHIADELGCAPESVRYWLRKFGIL